MGDNKKKGSLFLSEKGDLVVAFILCGADHRSIGGATFTARLIQRGRECGADLVVPSPVDSIDRLIDV